MTANKLKKINQIIALFIWLICVLMLCLKSQPVYGALFFIPFVMYPHAITHIVLHRVKTKAAQIILMIALISYFAWFTFIYINVFYLFLDAQSAIALLFVGIYATPIMLIFWLTIWLVERKFHFEQTQDIGK